MMQIMRVQTVRVQTVRIQTMRTKGGVTVSESNGVWKHFKVMIYIFTIREWERINNKKHRVY